MVWWFNHHGCLSQVEADFATTMKLYHGMELLTTQGLRSFHNFFIKENPEDKGMHKRIINELGRLPAWRDLLEIIGERFAGDATNSRLNSSRPQLSQAVGASQMLTKTSHPKIKRKHFFATITQLSFTICFEMLFNWKYTRLKKHLELCKMCKLCWSRKMLQNECFFAKSASFTAGIERSKIWMWGPESWQASKFARFCKKFPTTNESSRALIWHRFYS